MTSSMTHDISVVQPTNPLLIAGFFVGGCGGVLLFILSMLKLYYNRKMYTNDYTLTTKELSREKPSRFSRAKCSHI